MNQEHAEKGEGDAIGEELDDKGVGECRLIGEVGILRGDPAHCGVIHRVYRLSSESSMV